MMFVRSADAAFRRFKRSGDAAALAVVFDRTAAELLRVARHLASSESSAEDLLQATFVAAIEAADDHDDARPVLPWLVGILGNQARAARRRARRVTDPARLRPGTVVDPSQVAQARELSAEVEQAIRGLPEAYRPVLRLYLQDGLEPIEIARRLERPPGTVRAQVSRGLEALRRALPVSLAARAGAAVAVVPGRGLAAVRDAVLARCGGGVGLSGPASVSVGVLILMQKKLAVSVVGFAVLALIGYAGYRAWAGSEPGLVVARPLVQGGTVAQVHTTEGSAVQRAAMPDAASEVPPPVAGRASIRAVVTRARDGQPAVGIGVSCRPYRFDVVEHFARWRAFRTTDARGEVVFEDLEPVQYRLELDRGSPDDGCNVAISEARPYDVALQLPVGTTVRGVVRDHRGQAVASAQVVASDQRGVGHTVAITDAQGAYRCEDICAGWSLQARAPGHAPSLSHGLAGRAGSELRLDLTLTGAARRVAGLVRDADGQPLADALVVFVPRSVVDLPRIDASKPWRRSPFLRTDAGGRFTTDEVAHEEQVVVACAASRPDDAFAVAVLEAGGSDAFVDLQLRRGAVVEGRALDGDQPIPLTTVVAWAEKPADDIGYLLNLFGLQLMICGNDGVYRLSGLAPGAYHLQAMRGPRFAERRLTLAAGDRVLWNPNRAAGATLRLRLAPPRISLPGAGFPGWQVSVLRRGDQGGYEYVNSGTSAGDGRVTFTGLTPGRYDIVVQCQLDRTGRSAAWIAHRADLPTGADEIPIAIPEPDLPSAYFRGRVLDGAGLPVADARVVAVRHSDVQAASAEALSDGEGGFAIGPLTRGRYGLRIEHGPQPTFLGDRELFAGRDDDLGDVRLR